MTSGPKAKPSTKTETTNVANVDELLLKSSMSRGTPGANMADANGLEEDQNPSRPISTDAYEMYLREECNE
jgi:hypothetical protein